MSNKNSEGYSDPTATEAIGMITHEERAASSRPGDASNEIEVSI